MSSEEQESVQDIWNQHTDRLQFVPFEYKPTKREYFAAKAMQGLLSDVDVQRWLQNDPRFMGDNFSEVVAINSCEFADSLIRELNKGNQPISITLTEADHFNPNKE